MDVCKAMLYWINATPDYLKTQKSCDEVIENVAWLLYDVPDHFKTQKMCDKEVCKYPWLLPFVPDWLVTRQAKLWNYYCIDDGYIKWYKGYQKRKAQKAKIKEELASRLYDGLVCVRRREGVVEVTDSCWY